MIDRNEFFQGFIKVGEVKKGQLLKIIAFARTKTRSKIQPALEVEGYDKPLSLNATNLDFLIEAFGADESKWYGKVVKVNIEPVKNFDTGQYVDGIKLSKGKE